MASEWHWLTRTQASQLCGCGTANFDQRVRPRLGKEAKQGEGRTLRFNAIAVVEVWVKHQVEICSPVDAEEAAIVSGPDSPELEKLRAVKRRREELAYARDLEQITDITALRPTFARVASRLNEAGKILVKKHGNDAGDILNEALDDCERIIDRDLGSDTGDGQKAAARHDKRQPTEAAPDNH